MMCLYQASIDVNFDAGGKISSGLIATTIVSQWTWAATLLQSTSVTSKVQHHTSHFMSYRHAQLMMF